MIRTFPLAAAVAAVALAGCSGGASSSTTVTVTAAPSSTSTAATSTGTSAPAASPGSATASLNSPDAAAAAAEGEAPMDEAGPGGLQQLKAGQTATVGVLRITARWLPVDPAGAADWDEHGKKGCQPVQVTVQNASTADLMQPADGMSASTAEPWWNTSLAAGDSLRDAVVMVRGTAFEWPRRIKAGKTETFTTCWLADEREQHFTLSAHNGVENVPVATWSRS